MKRILHLVFAIVCISLFACSKGEADSGCSKEKNTENSIIVLDDGTTIELVKDWYIVTFPATRAMARITLPVYYRYTEDHVWVDTRGVPGLAGQYKIGITSKITDWLGDITFVEHLADPVMELKEGEFFAKIESTSSLCEIKMPWKGALMEYNPDMDDKPSVLNKDPYDNWMIYGFLMDFVEEQLMDAREYAIYVTPGIIPPKRE